MKGGGERARLEHNLQCRREHCITSWMRWQINQESQSVFVTCLATQLHFTRSTCISHAQPYSALPPRLKYQHDFTGPMLEAGPALGGENTGAKTLRGTDSKATHSYAMRKSVGGGLSFCTSRKILGSQVSFPICLAQFLHLYLTSTVVDI